MACRTWLRAPICPEPEIPPPVNLVCKKKKNRNKPNKQKITKKLQLPRKESTNKILKN